MRVEVTRQRKLHMGGDLDWIETSHEEIEGSCSLSLECVLSYCCCYLSLTCVALLRLPNLHCTMFPIVFHLGRLMAQPAIA
ncbi:hypothetical protein Ae201684_001642 [Aphanomyces euteiches]|uniref:Uncharacterized protein n=1 Tax=Aphanomyces euteiches TaxID=100861 RepID=A0A6G0XTP6_9STRA|nr:hypothetical protein Ae201684_001642 [Aphanomyces euteiches]